MFYSAFLGVCEQMSFQVILSHLLARAGQLPDTLTRWSLGASSCCHRHHPLPWPHPGLPAPGNYSAPKLAHNSKQPLSKPVALHWKWPRPQRAFFGPCLETFLSWLGLEWIGHTLTSDNIQNSLCDKESFGLRCQERQIKSPLLKLAETPAEPVSAWPRPRPPRALVFYPLSPACSPWPPTNFTTPWWIFSSYPRLS